MFSIPRANTGRPLDKYFDAGGEKGIIIVLIHYHYRLLLLLEEHSFMIESYGVCGVGGRDGRGGVWPPP